jgi:hypothetical protein
MEKLFEAVFLCCPHRGYIRSQFWVVSQFTPRATSWRQWLEYEAGVKWSPAYEVVIPEAEDRPPLEATAKQRDWEH